MLITTTTNTIGLALIRLSVCTNRQHLLTYSVYFIYMCLLAVEQNNNEEPILSDPVMWSVVDVITVDRSVVMGLNNLITILYMGLWLFKRG